MVALTMPFRNDLPNYTFKTTLSGTIFQLDMKYVTRMGRWLMNVRDATGNIIVSGVPVLITRDILRQYQTLQIPEGVLFALDDTNTDTQPSRYSFGLDHTAWYADPTQSGS